MVGKCGICGRVLDNPDDPLSDDCGGDCVKCMADCDDPDCVEHVVQVTGKMPDGSEPLRDRESLRGFREMGEREMAALHVFKLGVRSATLRRSGPTAEADAAEARFRSEWASAIEAGLMMRRIDPSGLRDRHPSLAPDAVVAVGMGWLPLVEEALADMDGLEVRVTSVREKFAGCVIGFQPVTTWKSGKTDVAGGIARRTFERSLATCEVCGGPGTLFVAGPGRTRCDGHRDLE